MPDIVQSVLPAEPVPDLAAYKAAGGGQGLANALDMQPSAVIEEVGRSGLRGRGGGGFPTGRKWASVAEAGVGAGEIYLVCNAAEGEPGTYKDRALMARDPYQIIEGVLIALHAVGAGRGFVAVKQRYSDELERLVAARDEMAEDADFPRAEEVRIVPGPDEYLFGEEKAMLEVIEGKLPMPRILPPYMQGLFATMQSPNPTATNNVETLAHVTRILAQGADVFREIGTEQCPGTMVFTVLGDVATAGVFELPMGTPLRTLVCELGGAEDVKAIYSGTSNTVITPELLDLPMDFDSFAEAGSGLGSGGFIVYDSSRDIVQVTAALARFLAIESCGQCLPCKLGTAEISERLDRLVAGDGTAADLAEIRAVTESVTDQNRCYLPVGAALLVRSTVDTFAEEFEAHIGKPSTADPVAVPKITSIDHDSGTALLDSDYHRKRSDWSYAPP